MTTKTTTQVVLLLYDELDPGEFPEYKQSNYIWYPMMMGSSIHGLKVTHIDDTIPYISFFRDLYVSRYWYIMVPEIMRELPSTVNIEPIYTNM